MAYCVPATKILFERKWYKDKTSKEESVMMHLLESAGLSPNARLASELFRLSVLETFETAWLRDFANSSRRWIWDGTAPLGGGLNICSLGGGLNISLCS